MCYLIKKDASFSTQEKYKLNDECVKEYLDRRSILMEAMEMEILFDQIVEAHWDFKNKFDYWRMRAVSMPTLDYRFNHEVRSSLNRLSFNLLNLSKLYLDKHKFKEDGFVLRVTKSKSSYSQIVEQRESIYDSSLEFVVGCKLRNDSQHSRLPVSSFSSGLRYSFPSKDKVAYFGIFYEYQNLVNFGVPKNRLTSCLKLELSSILDGYVYAISKMHNLNRKLTSVFVAEALSFIGDLKNQLPSNSEFCDYEILMGSGEIHYMSLDWFDVFHFLNEKHPFAVDHSSIKFS